MSQSYHVLSIIRDDVGDLSCQLEAGCGIGILLGYVVSCVPFTEALASVQ